MQNWEVGSEFEYDFGAVENCSMLPSWLYLGEDQLLTFSGRTSIDIALEDIKAPVKAYVPSYCCESMLNPFVLRNIPLSFYSVNFDDCLVMDFSTEIEKCNVLLIANYFGFKSSPFPLDLIRRFRTKGGVVIYDATHSLFMNEIPLDECDYIVASLRKWGPLLSGGFCCKIKGRFSNRNLFSVEPAFLSKKQKAMQDKFNYLHRDEIVLKKDFLDAFGELNHRFDENYQRIEIDQVSLNILNSWDRDCIRRKRNENARFLNERISFFSELQPLLRMSSDDCPLFFPVMVKNGKRDQLRKFLNQNGFYCTAHWPRKSGKCESNIFDAELSLTCDQRYNTDDMKKIIKLLETALVEI